MPSFKHLHIPHLCDAQFSNGRPLPHLGRQCSSLWSVLIHPFAQVERSPWLSCTCRYANMPVEGYRLLWKVCQQYLKLDARKDFEFASCQKVFCVSLTPSIVSNFIRIQVDAIRLCMIVSSSKAMGLITWIVAVFRHSFIVTLCEIIVVSFVFWTFSVSSELLNAGDNLSNHGEY